MEEEIGGKRVQESVTDTMREFLGCGYTVVFVEECRQWDLRDDGFSVCGLEQRCGWKVEGEY